VANGLELSRLARSAPASCWAAADDALAAERELRSRVGDNGWRPYPVYVLGLRSAWPWWHGYADELQVLIGYVSILEGCADGNVDRCARNELGDTGVRAIVSPYLAVPFEYEPELTYGGVNGCPVGLVRRDSAVDHAAHGTVHKDADVSPCG
jgi:hypothetical protein